MTIPGQEKTKNFHIPVFIARTNTVEDVAPVTKTDEEWKALLTPEQFDVARKKGTEYAFSGKYHATKEPGIYRCVCCGTDLFDAVTKFGGRVFMHRSPVLISGSCPIYPGA